MALTEVAEVDPSHDDHEWIWENAFVVPPISAPISL